MAISTKCQVYNVNRSKYTDESSQSYTVTLYDSNGDVVSSYIGYADNSTYSSPFSVTRNAEYYFIITCSPTLTVPYSVKGSGSVSNVTVLNPEN